MSKKPDDAMRVAGLASILQSSNRPKAEPAPPSPAPLAPPPAGEELPAPRKRAAKPVGKYRDPSFHQYAFYLRKDSHKRAKRWLEDHEAGKDVSELMQELLEQWLSDK